MKMGCELQIKFAKERLKEGEEFLEGIKAMESPDLKAVDRSGISEWKLRIEQFLKDNFGRDSTYYRSISSNVCVLRDMTDAEKIEEIKDEIVRWIKPVKAVIKDCEFQLSNELATEDDEPPAEDDRPSIGFH